jgi:hypothetical protein
MNAGRFNVLIPVIGVPGCGKSTYALKRAKQIARATPAYLIVHDPGWALPEDSAIRRYASVDEATSGLAAHPRAIHALSVANGDDVVAFALRCAAASLAMKGPPVLVLIDEGVAAYGMAPNRLSPTMANFLARRRWLNVGLIVTAQSPMLIHYQLFGLATEIVMFQTIDRSGLKRLERFSVPQAILARLPSMAPYDYVVHGTGGASPSHP